MNAPTCWRCKQRPGVDDDGVSVECVECASETARRLRQMLKEIDSVVTEGLPLLPRIMSRVEFIRECVQMQREIGSGQLRARSQTTSA